MSLRKKISKIPTAQGTAGIFFQPSKNYLRSSNGKILLLEVSDFDCFFNFCFKTILIQRMQYCPDRKFDFLGQTPDPDFSFDLI